MNIQLLAFRQKWLKCIIAILALMFFANTTAQNIVPEFVAGPFYIKNNCVNDTYDNTFFGHQYLYGISGDYVGKDRQEDDYTETALKTKGKSYLWDIYKIKDGANNEYFLIKNRDTEKYFNTEAFDKYHDDCNTQANALGAKVWNTGIPTSTTLKTNTTGANAIEKTLSYFAFQLRNDISATDLISESTMKGGNTFNASIQTKRWEHGNRLLYSNWTGCYSNTDNKKNFVFFNRDPNWCSELWQFIPAPSDNFSICLGKEATQSGCFYNQGTGGTPSIDSNSETCGKHLGNNRNDTWYRYDIPASAAPGTYSVTLRYAKGNEGTINPKIRYAPNGSDIVTFATGPSGSWGTFTTADGAGTIALYPNTAIYFFPQDGCNASELIFEYIDETAGTVTTPYNGCPWNENVEIPAWKYDYGADGYAYYDTNSTGDWKRSDGTGNKPGITGSAGNPGVIHHTTNGEWLVYTVEITTSGDYIIQTRACAGGGDNDVKYDIINESGSIVYADQSFTVKDKGWLNFSNYPTEPMSLDAGIYKIKLKFTGDCNIDWFKFRTPPSCATPTISESSLSGQTLTQGDDATALSVTAIGDGTLYYYCIVTNTCDDLVKTATSEISGAIVVNPSTHTTEVYGFPVTYGWNETVSMAGAKVAYAHGNFSAYGTIGTRGGDALNALSITPSFPSGDYRLASFDSGDSVKWTCVNGGAGGIGELTFIHAANGKDRGGSVSIYVNDTLKQTISSIDFDGACTTSAVIFFKPGYDNTVVIVAGGKASPVGFKVKFPNGDVGYPACATPSITSQPSSSAQTACVGGTAPTLNISVNDVTSYQWYRVATTATTATGGTLIEGATSASYTVPNGEANAYKYYCVVTNTCNDCTFKTATSNLSGAITINTPPAITDDPASGTYNKDASVTLSVVAAGSNLAYQWYSNISESNIGGSLIEGATSATYSPSTAVVNTFYYYCVVSNAGCTSATSDVATIVIEEAPTIVLSDGSDNQTIRAGRSDITEIVYTYGGNAVEFIFSWTSATPAGITHNITGNTLTISGGIETPQGTYTYSIYAKNENKQSQVMTGSITIASPFNVYYSQSDNNPQTLTNWNTERNGSGSAPTSFTEGDYFIIQHNVTTNSDWTVSGGSTIEVESSKTFTVNHTVQIDNLLNTGTTKINQSKTLKLTGNLTNNGTFNEGNRNFLEFNGNNAQISGTKSIAVGELTINLKNITDTVFLKNEKITLHQNSGGGNLHLTKGIFSIGEGNVLLTKANGTDRTWNITANGKLDTSGEYGKNGGTIQVEGNNMVIIKAPTANPLTVFNFQFMGNLGMKVENAGSFIVNGRFTVANNHYSWDGTVSVIYGNNPISELYVNYGGQGFDPDKGVWKMMATGTLGVTEGYPNNVTIDNVASGDNLNGERTIAGTLKIGNTTGRTFSLAAVNSFTCGGVYITNGSTLRGKDGNITVKGDWRNDGTFTHNNGNVILGASFDSYIKGTKTTTFNNLTINTSNAKTVTLQKETSVANKLTFNSGILTTSTGSILNVNNTSADAISGGSSTSFINGPVNWKLGENIYLAPTGKNSTYLPLGFTSTGNTTVSIEAFDTDCGGSGEYGEELSTTEYWQIKSASAANDVNVSIYRPTVVDPNAFIMKSSTANGTYKPMGGTAVTNGIENSDNFNLTAGEVCYVTFGKYRPTNLKLSNIAPNTAPANSTLYNISVDVENTGTTEETAIIVFTFNDGGTTYTFTYPSFQLAAGAVTTITLSDATAGFSGFPVPNLNGRYPLRAFVSGTIVSDAVNVVVNDAFFIRNLTLKNIADTSVDLGATIFSIDPPTNIIEKGTVFNTNAEALRNSDNNKEAKETGSHLASGVFMHTRSGLAPQTFYYYMAYAKNSMDTEVTTEETGSFWTLSAPALHDEENTTINVNDDDFKVTVDGVTFPATDANYGGYLILYSSTGEPALIAGCNGKAPGNNILNGRSSYLKTADTDLSSVPGNEISGLSFSGCNSLYRIKVIPYTWNGTNPETYHYYTDIPSIKYQLAGNSTPYKGAPWNIDQKIKAYMYDLGSENCAFYDTNNDNGYINRADGETGNKPDLTSDSIVGLTAEGEWMVYTIDIADSGYYAITTSASASKNDRYIYYQIYNHDHDTVSNNIHIVNKGTINFNPFTSDQLFLPKGEYKLKLIFSGDAIQVDWLIIETACFSIVNTGIPPRMDATDNEHDDWANTPERAIKYPVILEGATNVPLDDPAGYWKAKYDADNIYFLIQVKDSDIYCDGGAGRWNGDAVEIYFENPGQTTPYQIGFAAKFDLTNEEYINQGYLYGLSLGDKNESGSLINSLKWNLYPVTSAESPKGYDGYTLKIAIPRNKIGYADDITGINMEIAVNQGNNTIKKRDAQLASFPKAERSGDGYEYNQLFRDQNLYTNVSFFKIDPINIDLTFQGDTVVILNMIETNRESRITWRNELDPEGTFRTGNIIETNKIADSTYIITAEIIGCPAASATQRLDLWVVNEEIDTIVWTNGCPDDNKWHNRRNWYNYSTKTKVNAKSTFSENLVIVIPDSTGNGYCEKVNQISTGEYYPDYASVNDMDAAETGAISASGYAHHAQKLIVSYGASLHVKPFVEDKVKDVEVSLMIEDRNEWILIGPNLMHWMGEAGGNTRNLLSGDYYKNHEPCVYMNKMTVSTVDGGFETSWEDPFPDLDKELKPNECFAIWVPNQYGSFRQMARFYYSINPYDRSKDPGYKPVEFKFKGRLYEENTDEYYYSFKTIKDSFVVACNTLMSSISVEKLLERFPTAQVAVWSFNMQSEGLIANAGSFISYKQSEGKDVFIKPMQAFLFYTSVEIGDVDLLEIENQVCDVTAPVTYRAARGVDRNPTLEIRAGGSKYSSIASVSYDGELTTSAFDPSKDKLKVFSGYAETPDVFVVNERSLQSVTISSLYEEVPLGIRYGKAGTVTLSFSSVDEFGEAYLIDKELDITYNLNDINEIEVDLLSGKNTERFVLKFSNGDPIITDLPGNTVNETLKVYTEDGRHVIVSSSSNEKISEITVMNMAGTVVKSLVNTNSYTTIDMESFPAGVYMVNASTSTEVKTTKIVIK